MRQIVCALLASLTLVALPAFAGVLAPSKPSSMIELNSNFGSGTANCPFGGVAADSLNLPDGTRTPGFTVPTGSVLVVTEVDFGALVATSGILVQFTLARETPGAVNWMSSGTNAVSATDGVAHGHLEMDNSIVKSGVTLCVQCFNQNTHALITNPASCNGTVRGFLAKDK